MWITVNIKKYIESNKIYPESEVQSLFSVILKENVHFVAYQLKIVHLIILLIKIFI